MENEYSLHCIDNLTYIATRMEDYTSYLIFASKLDNSKYLISIALVETEDPFSPGFITFKRELYSFKIYTKLPVEHILAECIKAFSIKSFNVEYPEALIAVFGGEVNHQKPQWRLHENFH